MTEVKSYTEETITDAGTGSAARVMRDKWFERPSVLDKGAVGDWGGETGTDNADAFDAALAQYDTVYVPPGDYRFSRAIVVPNGKTIFGAGEGRTTLRRPVDDANTETIVDESSFADRNTLIFIKSGGLATRVADLTLAGNPNETAGTSLIETGNNVRRLSLERIRGTRFKAGLVTSGELWMTAISQVAFASGGTAFNLNNTGFKTTLRIANAYSENAGAAFLFRNMQYSHISACGADYTAAPLTNPYDEEDENPYGLAFGDPAASNGVYNFHNCKGIAVSGIGSENSWGNGMVRNVASSLAIMGVNCYNLQSAFEPNYTSFPNYGVGPFISETEAATTLLSGVNLDTYTQHEANESKVYGFGFNYLHATYGTKDYKMVTVIGTSGWQSANGTFGGQGDTSRYCVNLAAIT